MFKIAVRLLITCLLIFLGTVPPAMSAQRQAQYAQVDYDVVYVRCPRALEPAVIPASSSGTQVENWNGVNDLWLDATNNVYQQPGCDLVLHHSNPTYKNGLPASDMGREEVLVNCDESQSSQAVCTIADPNVSFDGRYVVYTKFTDTRSFVANFGINEMESAGSQAYMRIYPNGDGPGGVYAYNLTAGLRPYSAPALIYMYDLQTHTETQVSPDSKMLSGRAYPGKSTEWTGNVPVIDTGPFFLPDGRIGFTSNRDNGFDRFQLFTMDRDGRNMKLIGHRAMQNQLHPAILTDGRIMYTSFDRMLQKTSNNNFSLFTVNPDGSDPFILAGKFDSTKLTYHFATQLSDGDIVVTLYYMAENDGMGTLLRFPVDPAGPDFLHVLDHLGAEIPFTTMGPGQWQQGNEFTAFARKGEFKLTPDATAGDTQASPYSSSSDYWIHPVDGRLVTMTGKFTHPAAAPDNDLLVTYTIGGSSQQNNAAFKSLNTTMEMIGKDAGIWLLPLDSNSTRQVGHIADDARIVVDHPEYHEIMARPVVSYQRIYGIDRPGDPTANQQQASSDSRLTDGAPYGLTGASSLYDRETRAFNGTPWNVVDGSGAMSGRVYTNMATQGAELAIFDNDEIYGVRVLLPIPTYYKDVYPKTEKWMNYQRHHLRILGEFPVRKPAANGTEPTDGQGNPDTSFVLRIPADTPFLLQTLDKRGMALDIETASRSVGAGERQFCIGCHVHTRDGLDPEQASAIADQTSPFGDFTGVSAPLFDSLDVKGYPKVEAARNIYPGLAGVDSRRSFAVDWRNNVASVIQNRCASCHGAGQSAQQATGLLLDGTDETYDLLVTNSNSTVNANTKPGNGLSDVINNTPGTDRITPRANCCTPSRWVSINSARSSMLVWALYGERLDGRDPATGLPPASSGVIVDPKGLESPEVWPKVSEHAGYVSNMPESEKRMISRWVDLGMPLLNVHDDMIRPVLTLTPVAVGGSVNKVLVGVWDDSMLDYSKFRVTMNGSNIMSGADVQGAPSVIEVTLPTAVTEANADSLSFAFEIWDKPDRSLSLVQPGAAAANRAHQEVSGRELLRIAQALPANRAPSASAVHIVTDENKSASAKPVVTDPDANDSHTFEIVTQPVHGQASVSGDALVYIPATDFAGNDTFIFRVIDKAGAWSQATANVTINSVGGGSGTGGGSSGGSANANGGGGGGGAIASIELMIFLLIGIKSLVSRPGLWCGLRAVVG